MDRMVGGVYLKQIGFLAVFFLLTSLFKGWFTASYIIFWVGGIIGSFLPVLDHLIYAYFLRPDEADSKQVVEAFKNKRFGSGISMLNQNGSEQKKLIFHSILFQWLFIVFALLIITSSLSLLGRGLVLGFLLHLFIDQVDEFTKTDKLDNWFHHFSFKLDREKSAFYLLGMLLLLVVFGFFL